VWVGGLPCVTESSEGVVRVEKQERLWKRTRMSVLTSYDAAWSPVWVDVRAHVTRRTGGDSELPDAVRLLGVVAPVMSGANVLGGGLLGYGTVQVRDEALGFAHGFVGPCVPWTAEGREAGAEWLMREFAVFDES
jgi:hypothetical protein